MNIISEDELDVPLVNEIKRKFLRQFDAEISLIIRENPGWHATPEIEILSINREWVFGNVMLPIPIGAFGSPMDLLFVANRVRDSWNHALEGESQFLSYIENISSNLLAENVRPFLLGTQIFNIETDIGLPWARNANGRMSGGPHGNAGFNTPYSSLDFVPQDGIVRAPAAGAIFFSCKKDRVRVRIDHGGGYSTRYYHVDQTTPIASGSLISEGDYLGRISERVDCGGRASGPHVHFALMKNEKFVSVNGVTMGGWTFYNGTDAYEGRAVNQQTGEEIKVGGTLLNYGSAEPQPDDSHFPEGVVVVGKNNHLRVRSGPSILYPVQERLENGRKVRIRCTTRSELVTGSAGTSDIWNQLSRGGWVPDAWLDTGNDGPVAIDCACSRCP